jgi:CRP/FNR family cyclic AMP-dependent transcriptional regulator
MMQQMASRLRRTNRKVGDLAFTDTSGRVARTLLELSQQPDAIPDPQGRRVRITRHELGRIAGCSREMVSRVLRVLEERQMVSLHGRDILVLTPR